METLLVGLVVVVLLLAFGGQSVGRFVGLVLGAPWRLFLGAVREVGSAARGDGK